MGDGGVIGTSPTIKDLIEDVVMESDKKLGLASKLEGNPLQDSLSICQRLCQGQNPFMELPPIPLESHYPSRELQYGGVNIGLLE